MKNKSIYITDPEVLEGLTIPEPVANKEKPLPRVCCVILKQPLKDYPMETFFASKQAMIDYFGHDLGVTYKYIKSLNFEEHPFENKVCTIVQGRLHAYSKDPEGNQDKTRAIEERLKNNGNK